AKDHVRHTRQHPCLLTPPPSSPLATRSLKRQQIHGQSQCGLLTKLPIEIRLVIWESVIGGRRLHIFDGDEKLSHRSCEQGYPACMACCNWWSDDPGHGIYNANYHAESLLSLLRTCRWM